LHPKIEKLEEDKSNDKNLLKLGLDVLEGSRQRKESSKKKYYF